jgi:DNA-binding NarL/FixJ family response regulator
VRVAVGRFAPVVARGLVDVLTDDPTVSACAAGVEAGELEQLLTHRVVQAAIVDEAVSSVRCTGQALGVVVFAHRPRVSHGMVLLEAGVSCVADSAREGELLAAVHLAASGGCMFAAGGGERVERRSSLEEGLLTDREVQVLAGLSNGYPSKQIASTLGISASTVRTHTAALVGKLGAVDSRELVGAPVHWLAPRAAK